MFKVFLISALLFVTACVGMTVPVSKEQILKDYTFAVEVFDGVKEECAVQPKEHKCNDKIAKVETLVADADDKIKFLKSTGILNGDAQIAVANLRKELRFAIAKRVTKEFLGIK